MKTQPRTPFHNQGNTTHPLALSKPISPEQEEVTEKSQ